MKRCWFCVVKRNTVRSSIACSRMRSLLFEAVNRRIIAERRKRRNKKRNLKKKYCAESSIPSLLLETIKRRFIARRRKTRHRKKRELEKEYYADWSCLPSGILQLVAEKLTLVDCLSISKVCRSWNVSLGEELPCWQRHGFPWLLVSGQQDKEIRTCISILENRVWELELSELDGKYCWGSFRDWLIMVKYLDSFYIEVNLFNPFSGRQISLPRIWNFYHKIVLSGLPSEDDFICMLLHSQKRELAFWGRGADSWHKHKLTGEPFVDAVFCNGSFYLLGVGFDIWQIDAKTIYSSLIEGDDDFGTLSKMETRFHKVKSPVTIPIQDDRVSRYLVESSGELWLVCRYFGPKLETHKFEVFSLDFDESSWKKVENLGDQMIFLGKCCSTTFSAKELGVGIRNSIYFTNDQPAPWWNEWDSDHLKGISTRLGFSKINGRDWGVFRLNNREGEPFYFQGDIDNWAHTWFTAPSWWCNRNVPAIGRS